MKHFGIRFYLIWFLICLNSSAATQAEEPNLEPLVHLLSESDDPDFIVDILRGLRDGLSGRREMDMPAGWSGVADDLLAEHGDEIRALTLNLSLLFRSSKARMELVKVVQDDTRSAGDRRNALHALVQYRAEGMASVLTGLLGDGELRGDAVRALSGYQDEGIPEKLIEVYPSLSAIDRRSALNTLASRPAYAMSMLSAMGDGQLPKADLTADLVRQLLSLKDQEVRGLVEKIWGTYTESDEEKKREIQRIKNIYYAGGSTPGDASRGRGVYAKVCQQCHTLFEVGGSLGPDLTGSNRNDMDYLLQNMIDPNAVIPNEYRASTLEATDDRVITGIIRSQDNQSVTIQTADQEWIFPRSEIVALNQEELSMMPEGLLAPLSDQQIRDLIYYLRGPAQATLLATADTLDLFFNGADLTNWDGNKELWSVEGGEIVGKSTTGLRRNEFLISQMVLSDFRLICEVKLTPNSENSGIQFRSRPEEGGGVKGYQADVGQGWWGKLYEEHGRALLWDKSGDAHVRQGEWNRYEILAVGHWIKTAINGHECVNLHDPQGALSGIIAFQLHSGGPMEVRFRNLELEIDPGKVLKTARD